MTPQSASKKGYRCRLARTLPSIPHLLVSLLPALAIGIFLGSVGAARGHSIFGTSLFVPVARIVCIVVSVLLAYLFRNKTVNISALFTAAIAFTAIQLSAVFLTFILGDSERFALGVISTFSEGIALSLLMFLILSGLRDYPSKHIAVIISLGYVILNVYDCFFINASEGVSTIQWILGKIVTLVIVGILMSQKKTPAPKQRGHFPKGILINQERTPAPKQQGPFAEDILMNQKRTPAPKQQGHFPEGSNMHQDKIGPLRRLAPFAFFTVVILLIQGIYSYITGVAGVGSNALFDMTIGIYVVGVRVAVLAFCLIKNDPIRPSSVVHISGIMWASGLTLITILWDSEFLFVGSLVLNSGVYVLQPLILIIAVQATHRNLGHQTTQILFAMIAVEFTNHITRFITLFFVPDPTAVPFQQAMIITVLAFMAIIFALVFYFIANKEDGRPLSQDGRSLSQDGRPLSQDGRPLSRLSEDTTDPFGYTMTIDGLREEDLSDPLLKKEVDHYIKFKRLSNDMHLTQREEEVLLEALHGYTIENIADRLCLSRQTVKTYLSRSYNRLGVKSKQAVLKMLDSYGKD